jgi:hypothetical protein
MSELKDTPCAACREPVFEKGSVVLCSTCDAYQHLRCWSERRRCAASEKCKGKPVPVAVVRLAPPGPSAAEIADAVEAKTQELLHPMFADLRSAMAHAEDVETLREAFGHSAEAGQDRVEALARDLEQRTERIRQMLTALEARLASAPAPLGRDDLSRAAKEIRDGFDSAVRRAAPPLDKEIADLRQAVSLALHEVLRAVEACRWDTGARRHPLPWDGTSDDVLAPRAAGGAG